MPAVRPHSRFHLSPAAAAVAMALAPLSAAGATYTVTNTADSGPGSLRDTMTLLNATCLSDPSPTIAFAIPGTAPFVIAPASPLPTLSCGLGPFSPQIDATTQSGYVANTSATGFNGVFGIVLDGASLSSPGCGLHYNDPSFYGGELTIRGMDVKNFTYAGGGQALCGFLRLYGNRVQASTTGVVIGSGSGAAAIGSTSTVADRNVIANNVNAGISVSYGGSVFILNNLIGTPDGASAPTVNQTFGITWGGAPSGSSISQNVISGNGVGISLSNDNGTTVSNNMIGTNGSGNAALANLGAGIHLSSGFGTTVSGNVISGNADFGIVLSGLGGSGATFISGNKIGTDAGGNAAIPNLGGIASDCSVSLNITGNVISGNSGDAVQYLGVDNTGIDSNKIGVGADGVTAVPNGGNGIALDSNTCFGPSSGLSNGNGITFNTIAHNGGNGILLKSGVSNQIENSTIFGNGVKNININNTVGPLPNDAGDGDTGPNNQQNYPVISSVTHTSTDTMVNWALNTVPGSGSYVLQYFANPAPGNPAGQTIILATDLETVDGTGNASGSALIAGLWDNISMTARNNTNNDTSEFSPIVSAVASPAVTISPSSLTFGSIAVGATSPPQSSTLTSSGTANYQINKFDTAALCYGAPLCYGGPFICSTNCALAPSQYSPTQSCTITASFAPTSLGPQSSTIYICDNTSASPNTITLSGTGVSPPPPAPIQISPASQDFGSVPVGTMSTPAIFNVYNPSSTTAATLSGGGTTGPFQIVQSGCGSTLGPQSSCNVNVAFAPASTGPASGTFFVQSGASSTSASLAGTGTQPAPQLSLPPPIDVGAGTLGVSSTTQTITLTNTGSATLAFSSITVTAPFTLANNCPTNLDPGQSCTLVIALDNSNVGEFSGTLTIVSNGGSGTVPLSGRIQPIPAALLRVGPNTIGFGDRVAGSTSPAQRVTVTNLGGQQAAITGVNVSPDFVIVGNTCGISVSPQSSCFVDVAMRAIAFGTRVGQLVIGSNASNGSLTVSLAGTGCRPFNATSSRRGARSNCAP